MKDRIALLETICTALDRRHEVLELLEAADDPSDALERLQDVLGVDSVGAQIVLDLQLERLTASRRDQTAAELAEAHRRLRKVQHRLGN